MKNITMGQYVHGDSVIHRLDPRVKIIFVISYIIVVFAIAHFWMYIPLTVLIGATLYLSGIKPSYVLRGLKPIALIIFFTFILNLFMYPGEILFQYGPLTITKEGLIVGGFMALRLSYLIMGTSLLTLTTSPKGLTDGMDALLSPLSRIGFPTSQLTMMMTVAMRFIPTLFEETDKIMKAQMARGADFETGNMIQRAKNLIPLLVPLFLNAFHRAEELAAAMEARCYRVDGKRTHLKRLKMTLIDKIILILCILAVVFVFVYGR